MHHHEQPVSRKKIGKDAVFLGAGNQLVHVVNDGFEALQLLNPVDHGGLGYVDTQSSTRERGPGVGQ